MIISNYPDYKHADAVQVGDEDTVVHDDFQGLSHDKSSASFNTGKQLPYVDEDMNINHLPDPYKNLEESSLVHNAADVGRSDNYRDLRRVRPYCLLDPYYILFRICGTV